MVKDMNFGAADAAAVQRRPLHQCGAAVHPLKGVLTALHLPQLGSVQSKRPHLYFPMDGSSGSTLEGRT